LDEVKGIEADVNKVR